MPYTTANTSANITKLGEALALLKAHPYLHDQNRWLYQLDDMDYGTACCIAGWGCLLNGWKKVPTPDAPHKFSYILVEKDGVTKNVPDAAQEEFSLSPGEAKMLFEADNSLARLESLVRNLKDGLPLFYDEEDEDDDDDYGDDADEHNAYGEDPQDPDPWRDRTN
jgi:hypothetical protein